MKTLDLPTSTTPGDLTNGDERPVKDLGCGPCNGWLVATITRHSKRLPFEHNGVQKWDCTLGNMVIDRREDEKAPEGDVVLRCKTMERGGPADADFVGSRHRNEGTNYALFGQMLMRARMDYYGFSRHAGSLFKTYGYNAEDNRTSPMPGIMIYGSGPGRMDRRGAVLMHYANWHFPIIGCIGVYRGNEWELDLREREKENWDPKKYEKWQPGKHVDYKAIYASGVESYRTMVEIIALMEQFLGTKVTNGRCSHIRLNIIEEF